MNEIDLAVTGVSELNRRLHRLNGRAGDLAWRLLNPRGQHSIAVGLDVPAEIVIEGSVGYYCAGMNKQASIVVRGSAGPGLAENIMSGFVQVTGDASQYAAASGHGGLVVIGGDAAARCGISMKGVDIVVGGSVGHMSAFMAQAGNLVICGDAGHHLGDSIYEARIFVRGEVDSLGSDCVEKELRPEHREVLERLLERAGIEARPGEFRRYGSARQLYNFHIDNVAAY